VEDGQGPALSPRGADWEEKEESGSGAALGPRAVAAPARGAEREPLLSLNLPNRLTLARLVLAPVFGVLLLRGSHAAHIAALALYVLLALTDAYDGWLARRTGIVTSFGKFMDPLADKVLVSIALIVFVAKGLPWVPVYFVLIVIAREFLVTGLRSLTGFRGVVLVPSLFAKVKTVLQNLFVVATLAVIVLREQAGVPAAEGAVNVWLLAFAWAVIAVTILSGVLYFVTTRELVRRVFR
jgi:CDP-diacylglycerol--glycerol-3-phosphate 3-phosphatidyltransferase